MKKLLFCLTLLLSFNTYAETDNSQDSFLGFSFGDNKISICDSKYSTYPCIKEWRPKHFSLYGYNDKNYPEFVKGIMFYIIDNNIEGIIIATSGHKSQEDILIKLTNKYGKPKTKNIKQVQTTFGIKLNSIQAVYKSKNKTVIFDGTIGRIDSGQILIWTDTGLQDSEKDEEQKQKSVQSF